MLLVYRRTIEQAAALVGGPEALGVCLGVSAKVIELWIRGDQVPPTRHFLMAVDVLEEGKAGRRPKGDGGSSACFQGTNRRR